ncbi:unnamed protein product [Ectocarpus fasciculatus]
MTDITGRRCAHGECYYTPTYGVKGSGVVTVCAAHVEHGMVHIAATNKKCARRGCSKLAKFGVKGSGEREVCESHIRLGMVGLETVECSHEGCFNRVSTGLPGNVKRRFCPDHTDDNAAGPAGTRQPVTRLRRSAITPRVSIHSVETKSEFGEHRVSTKPAIPDKEMLDGVVSVSMPAIKIDVGSFR